MIKKITLLTILTFSAFCYSQVGINTEFPHASTDLELGSHNKALLLNRVENPTDSIADPQPGMIIYDATDKCVKAYQGDPPAWSLCLGLGLSTGGNATMTSLECALTTFLPADFTEGQFYDGIMTVPYTGGNGGDYDSNYFEVNGISFELAEGTLNTGDGNLEYHVYGTPESEGTMNIQFMIGNRSCTGVNAVVQNVDSGEGTVTALSCGSAAFNPAIATQGDSYTGILTVPYTGGNGGLYAAQSFTENGLTFTLAAGNFATGAGELEYSISGAPTASGSTSVDITAGGESCTGLTLTVNPDGSGVLPANITLAQNSRHWIASVYDTDYLPYTVPTLPASIAVVNADGTPEAVTVDHQGTITTGGVTVQIQVASATGTGTVGAWTSTFVVPAMYAEDGISRTLELSWVSQGYTASTKFITATLKSLGGTFNAKKLDINAGIGDNYLGLLLGAFQYPYNNAGALTSYEVRDIPGIPDRMFGLADNTNNTTTHMMLYLPVQAEDGKIWLNNNLGAHYSNINKGVFNPVQQATSYSDFNAYGSLSQWGRKPDGHELINWNNSIIGTPVNGTTSTKSNEPSHALFITVASNPRDWRITPDGTLWETEASANNPCPVGFRPPFNTEISALFAAAGITNIATAASSILKLPASGARDNHGVIDNASFVGYYWAGTANYPGSPYVGILYTIDAVVFELPPGQGKSVRCIQN